MWITKCSKRPDDKKAINDTPKKVDDNIEKTPQIKTKKRKSCWDVSMNKDKTSKTVKKIKMSKPNLKYLLVNKEIIHTLKNYLSLDEKYKGLKLKYGNNDIPPCEWHYIPQKSDEWFRIRKTGILTASRVANYIGLNRKVNIERLGLSKWYIDEEAACDAYLNSIGMMTNKKISDSSKVFMEWGAHEDSAVFTVLMKNTNIRIEECGIKYMSSDDSIKRAKTLGIDIKKFPNVGASPDGILIENNKKYLMEIKCPCPFVPTSNQSYFFVERKIKLNPFYIAQMCLQAFVWDIYDIKHIIYTTSVCRTYTFTLQKKLVAHLIYLISLSNLIFEDADEDTELYKIEMTHAIHKYIKFSLEHIEKIEDKYEETDNYLPSSPPKGFFNKYI